MEENKHFTIDWTNCRLCPRECGADRTRGFGACKVGNTITAARAALHMWEEPCISGDEGSGAVFFSGCNLGCVYCQNREIALGHSGRTITQDRLCEIYMELQEKKANNINLVTAGHKKFHGAITFMNILLYSIFLFKSTSCQNQKDIVQYQSLSTIFTTHFPRFTRI